MKGHQGQTGTGRRTERISDSACCRAACGVCQDFAHALLGLCRAVKIPARYVSGYLATEQACATHAWTEVLIPEIGWRALDPTHDCQPGENYVKIAVGRDYADVAPVSGHYVGTTERQLEVVVRITSVAEPNLEAVR